MYEFAGPWPRARQVMDFLFVLQHLLRLFSNLYIFMLLQHFYVCLTTFTISGRIVVHCSDNCCLLFKKWAREGGCQGAPGLNHRYLFHLLTFIHYHLLPKVTSHFFVKHVPKMVLKSIQNVAPNRYIFLLRLFAVSRSEQKSEHVFAPCLCSPNHFGHRSHGTRNKCKSLQKRYTNTPRKHD